MQIYQEMKFWDSLRISFIFARRFNFETENTSKSIVQPSFIFPIGCWSSAPSNLFYCFVCSTSAKIPPKETFSSSDRIGIAPLYPIFANRPIQFSSVCKLWQVEKLFSPSNLKLVELFAFCVICKFLKEPL